MRLQTWLIACGIFCVGAAHADLIDDVRDGTNIDFDVKGMTYSYSGAASGSGVVADGDAVATAIAKNAGTLNCVIDSAAFGVGFSVNVPFTGTKVDPTTARWTTNTVVNQNVTITLNGTPTTVKIYRIIGTLTSTVTSVNPFFDAVCGRGYNVRLDDLGGDPQNFINVEAYLFAIMLPSFRVDFQLRTIDYINFAGVSLGRVQPTSYVVTHGTQSGGSLASLFASDDNRLGVRADELDPSPELEIYGFAPYFTQSQIRFDYETSCTRRDMVEIARVWNWTLNSGAGDWDDATAVQRPVTLIDSASSLTVSASASNLIEPTTREMRSQIHWEPLSDNAVSDGWVARTDVGNWFVNP